ncbi:uncharacterized histidine-rich protein DDB_G0274557-like [Penaeus chinensis]|uniref:uncharacterized histidine-rich protein DDB_G0274557-like n=1 Tax=Penaeus chinensis TaxID=139456 RepID=UPI001FB62BCF|nr:uncharacterized histidine-rich protein DDB_G0274557-like [Penaeus chinensis]
MATPRSEAVYKWFPQAVGRGSVHSEPRTGPAMKFTAIALVCLAAAVVTHADPEPHKYHHYPYYHYDPLYHDVEPLEGDGVARHPGGGTSFVGPQVHGLTKRSADPMPEADPEPVADSDTTNSYSYQIVHHGHPHYGYRYPYSGYRHNNFYGYPHRYHSHHKRSVESEPEPEPHYSYYGRPHYYNRYYHGYPHYYPYAGYRYGYGG